MKVIKCDLSNELDHIELHIFADEHLGDEHCDLQNLRERIKYVEVTPNAFCVLNGDLMDNATKTSIGDTYASMFNPMEQIELATELFSPIKHKILAITHGNHEARTYRKEGIDLSAILASRLGLIHCYSPTSALLFLRFGRIPGKKETNGSGNLRKRCYTLYMLHGSGGGRKEGAKAIRLADMVSIIDTDVYIHSHTHLPMIMKQGFHRIDPRNNAVACVDKLFVNTAANLNYGGYGETQEFKPSSKKTPVIWFSGSKKEMNATL